MGKYSEAKIVLTSTSGVTNFGDTAVTNFGDTTKECIAYRISHIAYRTSDNRISFS